MLATTTEAAPNEDVFVPLNLALFRAIVAATVIGIPLYGYYFGFSLFDWVLSFVIYIITGMGITIGSRPAGISSELRCPNSSRHLWPRGRVLALRSSSVGATTIPPSSPAEEEKIPTVPARFWHSHCGWLGSDGSFVGEMDPDRLAAAL